MLNKFSNLGKTLSREEQKNVLGGMTSSGPQAGTCAYTYSYEITDMNGDVYEVTVVEEGVSKATALENVAGGGHWCCSSCASASWL